MDNHFKLNRRDAALNCGARKQATIAISSSEAKYKGMAAEIKKALYVRQLLEGFITLQKHPIVIGEHNKTASNLAKTQSCARETNT